jgi:hypothetical protein
MVCYWRNSGRFDEGEHGKVQPGLSDRLLFAARFEHLGSLGLFIVGWIFQFVGHAVYEKKSPAFMKNFEHLFIGPPWVFAKAIG